MIQRLLCSSLASAYQEMILGGQNCRCITVAWAHKADRLLDYKDNYLSQGTKNGTKNDWKTMQKMIRMQKMA
jgi:hypothetical protein